MRAGNGFERRRTAFTESVDRVSNYVELRAVRPFVRPIPRPHGEKSSRKRERACARPSLAAPGLDRAEAPTSATSWAPGPGSR